MSEDVDLQQLAQSLERYSGADVAWWSQDHVGIMEEDGKTKGLCEKLFLKVDILLIFAHVRFHEISI